MNWTEQKGPTEGISHYDHITLKTPIGIFIIEWKSWKTKLSYDIQLNNEWIGFEYDLKSAKDIAENHILNLTNELNDFVKK